MNKKVLSLMASVALGAGLLVGCGGGSSNVELPPEPKILMYTGAECPVTGKNMDDPALAENPEYMEGAAMFEYQGTNWEIRCSSQDAANKIEDDPEKYIEKIKGQVTLEG